MMQRRRDSHVEGLANPRRPRVMWSACEGVTEALTGAHAGRVLSREIEFYFQVPRLFPEPKATPEAPREARRSGTWRGRTPRPRACVEASCARTGRPCDRPWRWRYGPRWEV